MSEKVPTFSGDFAAFNQLFKAATPKTQTGQYVSVSDLPKPVYDKLFTQQICPFFTKTNDKLEFIFEPVRLFSGSPDFDIEAEISPKTMQMLQNGASAVVICISDTENPKFFYPAHFSILVNHNNYSPNPRNTPPNSLCFWIDITRHVSRNPSKLTINSSRAISGSPYFCCCVVLNKLTNEAMISRIAKHCTIEEWDEMFQKSGPIEDGVSEPFLTVPLFCPLLLEKIHIPIRSRNCEHLSCVDAGAYFEYQRLKGDWRCPTCNSKMRFDDIFIDDVNVTFLSNTGSDTESIKVTYKGRIKNR